MNTNLAVCSTSPVPRFGKPHTACAAYGAVAILLGSLLAAPGCGSKTAPPAPAPTPVPAAPAVAPAKPPAPVPVPAAKAAVKPAVKPADKPAVKPAEKPVVKAPEPEKVVPFKLVMPAIPPAPRIFDLNTSEGQSLDNLQKIAAAMLAYHAKENHFPPPAIFDKEDQPLLSWRVALLPYLGMESLYQQFHLNEPWDSAHNKSLLPSIPDVYQTPDISVKDKKTATAYLVMGGKGTLFADHKGVPLTVVTQSPGKIILVFEGAATKAVPWTQPENVQIASGGSAALGRLRGGAALLAFADGVARRLDAAVDPSADPAQAKSLFLTSGARAFDPVQYEAMSKTTAVAAAEVMLLTKSEEALKAGKIKEGYYYFLADGVVRRNPAVFKLMRWSPALKRPLIAVRWALASQIPGAAPPAGSVAAIKVKVGGIPQFVSEAMKFCEHSIHQEVQTKLEAWATEGRYGKWVKEAGEAASAARPNSKGLVPGDVQYQGPMGVVHFTVGEPSHLRRIAAAEGVDVLVTASLLAKPVHGANQWTLSLQLIDLMKNVVLWKSEPLNTLVGKTRPFASDEGQRALAKVLDDLTAYIDANFILVDMPDLTAESVRKRANALAAWPKGVNPLPALAELRYYESLKLLTAKELTEPFSAILGDEDGLTLATGPEEARRKVVQKLLGEGVTR